jgi:hypothetical protein
MDGSVRAHRWKRLVGMEEVLGAAEFSTVQQVTGRLHQVGWRRVLWEQPSRVAGRIFRVGCGISERTPRTSPPVFVARAALAARRISTARYNPRCCTPHPDLNAQFHEEEGNRAIVLCMTTAPDERTSANSRTPLPHPTAWLHVYCQYLPSPIPPKIAAPMPKRRPE